MGDGDNEGGREGGLGCHNRAGGVRPRVMRPPNTYRTMDVLRSLAGGGRKEGGDNLGPYIFLSFGDCPHFLPQNKSSGERGSTVKWKEKKVHCPDSPLLTFWVMGVPPVPLFLFFPAFSSYIPI